MKKKQQKKSNINIKKALQRDGAKRLTVRLPHFLYEDVKQCVEMLDMSLNEFFKICLNEKIVKVKAMIDKVKKTQ